MRILSINLASHGSSGLTTDSGHIAVCSEDSVLAWSDSDHRLPDNELIPLLEATLAKADLNYKDLTHIACVTGPGGFTSIRSAVTLANVLSHELNIPAAGIHLSDLYFAQASPPGPLSSFVAGDMGKPHLEKSISEERGKRAGRAGVRPWWLHSTKKEQLFVRGKSVGEPTLMMLEDTLKLLQKNDAWMGELIELQEKAVSDLGLVPAELLDIEKILPQFLAKQSYKNGLLEPWYGRGW